MLEKNEKLEELYLGWNKITGVGGAEIAQGLLVNNQLYVLDFSNNSLGGNSKDCALEI